MVQARDTLGRRLAHGHAGQEEEGSLGSAQQRLGQTGLCLQPLGKAVTEYWGDGRRCWLVGRGVLVQDWLLCMGWREMQRLREAGRLGAFQCPM